MPTRPDPDHASDAPDLDGTGIEWIVEARGCDAERLRDVGVLGELFDRMTAELRLRRVEPVVWHVFPGQGGITGMCLLAESHLTCHTFPEHESLCLNLFCCRRRPEWDFHAALVELLGAKRVDVRRLGRAYGSSVDGPAADAEVESGDRVASPGRPSRLLAVRDR